METRLPAPSLVVLVGPSASGKSTWAAEHFQPNEIVSSDELRSRVGIDSTDQRASGPAFDILERIIAARLARKLTTVVDTLGYDAVSRTRWIDLAHQQGVPAYAVTFPTPEDECLRRNALRQHSLPLAAVRKQVARFAAVAREVSREPFDDVLEQAPVRVVAPQLATHKPSIGRRAEGGHTFGLVLNRFQWGDGAFLGEQLASVARRAEAAGFRDIWLMDHFRQIPQVGPSWEDLPEAYTTLAYLAAFTSQIRLGALVTGVTHRPPAVLGKMIATLDVISSGRANCGIGLGWDEKEHLGYGLPFPSVSQRYAQLEDVLQMLPLLWGKGSPSFEGATFSAAELTCYPRPVQEKIPILIGGSGERRTLRLVAKYGDACNLFGKPEVVKHKVEVIQNHCESLGRESSEIEIGHLVTAMVATEDGELRRRVNEVRSRNQTFEQYITANNAGLADDMTEFFGAYHEAGARHSVVALPDVHLDGAIEDFGKLIERFG